MFKVSMISGYMILGLPLVIWLGILTILCVFIAASIPTFRRWKIWKVPLEWHYRMAAVAIILAVIHGLMVLLPMLGL